MTFVLVVVRGELFVLKLEEIPDKVHSEQKGRDVFQINPFKSWGSVTMM